MNYIFITYDGAPFPIAKQLMDEGNQVLVSMVNSPKDLGVESGLSAEGSSEEKRRRLSIYDGILNKIPLEQLFAMMEKIPNKDDWFVFFDYNNLYKLSDRALKMGFTKGLFPNKEDFDREKDRNAAKAFVKKHYTKLKVAETTGFKKIDDAIKFLNEKGGFFALKSDGNYVDTVVPLTNNEDFARDELIFQLQKNKTEYEKGFTLEQKIIDPIEVAPQIVFWDGVPVYSHLDMETRMIGPNDVGFQTGGNQNILMATNLDDPINKMAFPPIVYELAKNRKGMFLFDAGILFDEKGDAYFTEFAGNRFGWGGAFSEISMARKGERVASEYFEAISQGKNPQKFKFGSTLTIYNMQPDKEYANMFKEGMPLQWDPAVDKYWNPYLVRKEVVGNEKEENKRSIDMNVGLYNMLGYATGCGNTFKEAVDKLYEMLVDKVYMGGMYYRSKNDFLASDYPTAITNRINFLLKKGLTTLKMPVIKDDSIMESYMRTISNSIRR